MNLKNREIGVPRGWEASGHQSRHEDIELQMCASKESASTLLMQTRQPQQRWMADGGLVLR